MYNIYYWSILIQIYFCILLFQFFERSFALWAQDERTIMKICLINNLYPPYAVGGAEKAVERQTQEFLKQGDEVFIITTKPYSGLASFKPIKAIENGITIYRFYPLNICWYKNLVKHNFVFRFFWHLLDIFNFNSALIIRKILLQEQVDEVYTHNLMGVGFCLPRLIQKGKVKTNQYTYVNHNHYLHDVQLVEPSGVLPWNHEKDNILQKIYSAIMRWLMGTPDVVISPTEFLKKFYQARGFFPNSEYRMQNVECRIEKIVNDQDTRNKQYPISNIQYSNNHQSSVINHRFLYVGSLVQHKGIKILMQAWKNINDKELNIVGSGKLEGDVREWATGKNNVFVYGRKEWNELQEIYQKCDFLIFPSICLENNPTVIHEALQNGLKVIASKTGGVEEIFGNNKNVKLFEPGNVDELSEAIKNN